MTTIWQNGKFINDGPLFLPTDRIRIGDGVFDTMLAIDGKLVHSKQHFTRLLKHAAIFKIETEMNVQAFEEAAKALLSQNKFTSGHYVINTIITRGPAERGLRVPDKAAVQTIMMTAPAPAEFPPIEAIIAQDVRRNEGSPLSNIKSCNYGDSILALIEAKDGGANEAILLNNRGNVACSSGSNVFVVIEGQLFTPPLEDGALDGIIRQKMIKKMGAREKSLGPDDLFNAEGIYLTNSVRGVVAVETLNGKRVRRHSLEIDKDFHLI